MNRLYFFVAAVILLTVSACTQPSDQGASGTESKKQAAGAPAEDPIEQTEVIDPNTLYLEGLYATSTQLPEEKFAIEKIFDSKDDTYWTTMKGAGPDEGFMLYFMEEIFVKKISLKEMVKAGLADIKTVTVYTNGNNLGSFSIADPIEVNKKVKSLYIRIKDVDNLTTAQSSTDDMITIETFNRKMSVGISEITLTGENEVAYTIIPPTKVEGRVDATSVLSPQISYHPNQLFDSRKEFVYAEGAPGSGENESLTFTFDNPVKMDGLKIWNGFQRSDKHYTANARIKSFEFGTKDKTSVYALKDVQTPQEIKLKEALDGSEFIFKIIEVYPGGAYKDAVISEMRFLDKNNAFVLRNKDEEKNVQALQEKVKKNVLGDLLDRRIKNTYDELTSGENSIILRSDNTFVLYENDKDGGESREIIGDGSWELVEMNADNAKIRVFGKLLDLSKSYDEYSGSTSSSSYLKIFQDFVIIDQSSLKGEKFVRYFSTGSESGK